MSKDYSKYIFAKEKYGKNHLVLEIIKDYINTHKDVTYSELLKQFPIKMQNATETSFLYDVFMENKYIIEDDDKRYFPEVLKLSDGVEIRICNQWDKDNLPLFIQHVKKLGYYVEKVDKDFI